MEMILQHHLQAKLIVVAVSKLRSRAANTSPVQNRSPSAVAVDKLRRSSGNGDYD